MKLLGFVPALFTAVLLVGGCAAAPVSATSGPTAASVPALGGSLSPADFAAAAKLPNTVLLDVRTPAEFAAGHISGAVNLDVQGSGFAEGAAALDPAKTYAVYCHSGNRSKVAMAALQQGGFTHVFDLAGGISAWQSAGGQVVTD